MGMNEADTKYHRIDPVLREKGYTSVDRITLETILTPPPVEPTGAKGRRRKGPGRTDYLLCVQTGTMPRSMPIAVLEAKREDDAPLKGMQQAKGYADTLRFEPQILKDGVKRGPTVHSLISDYLEELEIPLLTEDQQRCIAARLKAQLAEVETARQAAQRQLAELEILPQRLLAQAFES